MRAQADERHGVGLADVLSLAALGYFAYVGREWLTYGRRHAEAGTGPTEELLARFLPEWDVAESHALDVYAPAGETYEAARALNLNRSALARLVFAARALPARFGGEPVHPTRRSLVQETQSLGWRVLAEVPGRALVMGAVTRPWEASVTFRGLDPEAFAAFQEPGYVKIVWTLEAEPIDAAHSRFRTQTRVATTDADARRRFRRYWAFVAAGVRVIRRTTLPLVKRDAERRFAHERARKDAALASLLHRSDEPRWIEEGLGVPTNS